MIFLWKLAVADLELVDRGVIEDLLSESVRSHRQGKHLVVIPLLMANWLLENINLRTVDRSTLRGIREEGIQTLSFARTAAFRIEIVYSNQQMLRVGGVVEIDIRFAPHHNIFDSTSLVVENADTDGELLLYVANSCRRKVGIPNLSYTLVHGGGDTSESVAIRIVNEFRLTVLLIDSDRLGPEHPPAKDVAAIAANLPANVRPLFLGISWPCREIENTIPIDVLVKLPCSQGRESLVSAFIHIADVECEHNIMESERYFYYADLKQGTDSGALARILNQDSRIWIEEKLLSINLQEIGGFGSQIINHLLLSNEALSELHRQISRGSWWDVFGECLSMVMWFGVAARPKIT